MSNLPIIDTYANWPYQILAKDNDGKYSTCETTKNKEAAVSIATIYLKTYKYVKVIYVPTGETVWEAGDIFKSNITTLRKGELVQLNDDYVLEALQLAIVSNYPKHMLSADNIIIGDGKSTCKELIKEKAKGDLIDIENQLRELTEAVIKLKEVLEVK